MRIFFQLSCCGTVSGNLKRLGCIGSEITLNFFLFHKTGNPSFIDLLGIITFLPSTVINLNNSKPTMSTKEETPVADGDKPQTSSWKDSIYNPRTGEFIGRTAKSWDNTVWCLGIFLEWILDIETEFLCLHASL
ncbi:unnamed protein product [Oncorhynchus mykiss]|uniref:Uncharacterized protein n=1 Tax=Oncorhynchus mykiss TaxID=8022 RepID=A0A060W616_ONCMY|nr:unnamed protein product [Oncorhynchus mykiss]